MLTIGLLFIGFMVYVVLQNQEKEQHARQIRIETNLETRRAKRNKRLFENPIERLHRQTVLDVSFGEAMSAAKKASVENQDRWFVVQENSVFSAVSLGEWIGSGQKLIAVFDNGWQLPDKG